MTPIFRFTDETPRMFPEYGDFEQGDTVTADENPDPHFFEPVDVAAPVAPAPEPADPAEGA